MARMDNAESVYGLIPVVKTSLESELIQRLQMAEACLDDAEGTARHLALDLMGFGEIRQKLRGIKAEMALRILEAQRQSE